MDGAVSGRWQGATVAPTPGAAEIDLRLDVDATGPDSPVMEIGRAHV